MNKLLAAMMSAVFALAAGSAFAADEMKKDGMMKKDTMTLICEVIDTMEGVDDPSRMKNLISELYTEALQT